MALRLFVVVALASALVSCTCSIHDTTLGSNDGGAAGCGGLTDCNGTCRDLTSDRAACGACDVACSPGFVCSSAACVVSCQGGLSDCDGGCRSLPDDRLNCGACGVVCGAGEQCTDGQCTATCGSGLSPCGGSCRDLNSDEANCGRCGEPCAAGAVCVQGTCTTVCPSGFDACDGGCRDVHADGANCGGCGVTCSAGEVCAAGHCQASCGPGTLECSGACIDPASNPQHCGATAGCGADGGVAGVACAPGAACVGGSCTTANVCSGEPLAPAQATHFSVSSNARATMADVNRDGLSDVVAVDLDADELLVLIGAGDAGFQAPRRISLGAGSRPVAVVVADMNGDQFLDAVIAENRANRVTVRSGDGLGGFPGPGLSVPLAGPISLAVGDANGDLVPDITVGTHPGPTSDQVMLLRATAGGGYAATSWAGYPGTASPLSVAMGDLNGDGRAEIVAANYGTANLMVFAGVDAGVLAAPTVYATQGSPRAVAIADLDNDSDLDVVAVTLNGHTVVPLLGDGTGALTAAPTISVGDGFSFPLYLWALAIGDVTGDGRRDVITTASDGAWVLPGVTGGALFGMPMFTPLLSQALSVSVGRLDADARDDVVVGMPNADLAVLHGNANATLTAEPGWATHGGPQGLAVLHLDPDPYPDVIISNIGTRDFTLLRGDGDGGYSSVAHFDKGFSSTQLTASDLNRDGLDDFLGIDYQAGGVWVMLGQGDGGFTNSAVVNDPTGVWTMTVGDFTSDGVPDLIGSNTSLRLFRGVGNGTFDAGVTLDGGSTSYAMLPIDVNRDGRLDLVAGDCSGNSGLLRTFLGNGNGTFSAPLLSPSTQCPLQIRGADLNADTFVDVVVIDGTGELSVRLGDGLGHFSWGAALATLPSPGSMDLADFDGDGLTDIFVSNQEPPQTGVVSLFFGLGQGRFTAAVRFSAGIQPSVGVLADMNLDGRADVVLTDYWGNQLLTLLDRRQCGP